jgi:phospholipid/cholesterol/gamma-HCH transport system ATP-binding protein
MSDTATIPAMIALQGIHVTLGGFQALEEVSVAFPQATCTVIMGPSGSGKSTLLKVAAGLIPPDRGRVFFRGQNMYGLSERGMLAMRKVNGFVFQDGALWENRTLFENLSLPLRVHFPEMPRAEVTRRVARALERVGMEDSATERPAALSGGEKKIASFLRATVTDPSLLFLDEPTLSIDFAMADRINQMIRDLKARGCTILAITHDAALTSSLADRLLVIDQGKVLAAGAFDEIKQTRDARTRAILAQVLGEIASYDGDLLELLGGDADGGSKHGGSN